MFNVTAEMVLARVVLPAFTSATVTVPAVTPLIAATASLVLARAVTGAAATTVGA